MTDQDIEYLKVMQKEMEPMAKYTGGEHFSRWLALARAIDEIQGNTSILDPIVEEINDQINWHFRNGQEDYAQVLTTALEIISKYRKE